MSQRTFYAKWILITVLGAGAVGLYVSAPAWFVPLQNGKLWPAFTMISGMFFLIFVLMPHFLRAMIADIGRVQFEETSMESLHPLGSPMDYRLLESLVREWFEGFRETQRLFVTLARIVAQHPEIMDELPDDLRSQVKIANL